MELVEIITLIANAGVPAAILIILILKGFPILNVLVTNLKERNGELHDLIIVIKDLVETLNQRR